MISRTTSQSPTTPEISFLLTFLSIRRQVLQNPKNTETTKVWRESVSRVNSLEALVISGNTELSVPVTVLKNGGQEIQLGCERVISYDDSGAGVLKGWRIYVTVLLGLAISQLI